jgi:hypothetical protein
MEPLLERCKTSPQEYVMYGGFVIQMIRKIAGTRRQNLEQSQ